MAKLSLVGFQMIEFRCHKKYLIFVINHNTKTVNNMNEFLALIFVLLTFNTFAGNNDMTPQDNKNMRLVLVKQQTNGVNIVVGLKTVPEYFNGTIEEYCLELANKLANDSTVLTFKPLKSGKSYSVASLTSGFISFQPFSSDEGIENSELLEEFIKSN